MTMVTLPSFLVTQWEYFGHSVVIYSH